MGEEFHRNNAPDLLIKMAGRVRSNLSRFKNNADYLRRPGNGSEVALEYGKTETPKDTDYYYIRSSKATAKWLDLAQSGLANHSSAAPCDCESGE